MCSKTLPSPLRAIVAFVSVFCEAGLELSLAISAVNKSKVEALKTEFIKIFNYAPKPEAMQPVVVIPPDSGKEE
ncbi:hypothetical protein BZK24_08660, partial [Helicobacter pylori]